MRESLRTLCHRVTRGVALLSVLSVPVFAQSSPRFDLGGDTGPGTEAERYLRLLQVAGIVPLYPWSMQPFSRAGLDALAPEGRHPWSARSVSADSGRSWIRVLRPEFRLGLNSGFPVHVVDGPAWYGRGTTGEAQGGVFIRWKRLSLQIAPVAFLAQNLPFPLPPTGATGAQRFVDPRFPSSIDLPVRFGEKPYGRIDAGSSFLELALPGTTLGVSTAPERWGPGLTFPLILGPNGGGFPHVFLGTSAPVNLWLVKLNARYLVGELSQSSLSLYSDAHQKRLSTGFVISFTPRWFDGVEVGAISWSDRWMPSVVTIDDLRRPFISGVSHVFGPGSLNVPGENRMASAFFRWVAPRAGLELFGELYREDYAGDYRTLLEKPDDLASYAMGFQYVYKRSPEGIKVLRAEVVNGQLSHQERGQRGFVNDEPPYIHTEVQQGHTVFGLLLGSPDAYGGAGLRIAFEEYTAKGRTLWEFQRSLQMENVPALVTTGPITHADVLYGIRYEQVRFAGARDYTLTIFPAIDLNRYTLSGNDKFNLYVALGVRGWR